VAAGTASGPSGVHLDGHDLLRIWSDRMENLVEQLNIAHTIEQPGECEAKDLDEQVPASGTHSLTLAYTPSAPRTR
jgi:hypothetical protein